MKNTYILVLLFFCLIIQCSNLLDTVADLFISDEEEVNMGKQFHQEILNSPNEYPIYTAKPSLNNYIDSIGQIIATVQDRNIDYHFTIIDDDTTINAFAAPGGYIYIYTGLILAADNETEVAGVLAHEIGHIVERHSIERLLRIYGRSFIIEAIFGQNAENWSQIYNTFREFKYSKEAEFEADSCAAVFLSKADYNPIGMRSFLKKLLDFSGPDSFLSKLLSTHPPTEERIESVHRIISRDYSSDTLKTMPPVKIRP